MYAVIKAGGRQLKVTEGQRVNVDLQNAKAGDAIEFAEVLMLSDGQGNTTVGTPAVAGAKVTGKVLGAVKGDKLVVFKKRRRKHGSKVKRGHRQPYTAVKVEKIEKP